MDKATSRSQGLKAWFKSRPRLDIDESATWFLLLFVYAHDLTADELGFKMSGMIPQLTMPQISLVMVLLCLAVSVVVLIEPLLPSKMRDRTKTARHSYIGQFIRRIGVWVAFALGLTTGFSLLVETIPTLSWLIVGVFYAGFVIFIVMGVKLVFLVLVFLVGGGRGKVEPE